MKKSLIVVAVLVPLAGCAAGSDTTASSTGTHTQYTTGSGGGGAGGGASGCVPNRDGKIDASELLPAFDVDAHYQVSLPGKMPAVDLAGVDQGGTLVWDFSQPPAETSLTVQANRIEGKWYASWFPAGQWVTPFDDTTDAVYSNDEQGIYLHGLCTRAESADPPNRFVYDTGVMVYQFPLVKGSSWTSVGTVSKHDPPYKAAGLIHTGTHTYTVTDDAVGTIKMPDKIDLEGVHRLRTTVLVHPSAGVDATTRQTGFVFECLGEIVRATSDINEQNDNFDPAAELRRLKL